VVLLLATAAAGMAQSKQGPTADWRFGRIKVTDFGEGEVNYYMSLRNKGKPSREAVLLYAMRAPGKLPPGRQAWFDKDQPPVADLTRLTRGKRRSAVVDITVALPPTLSDTDAAAYWLVLVVDDTITDLLPIRGGEALLKARERLAFHK
jgi:hypothetical protein